MILTQVFRSLWLILDIGWHNYESLITEFPAAVYSAVLSVLHNDTLSNGDDEYAIWQGYNYSQC